MSLHGKNLETETGKVKGPVLICDKKGLSSLVCDSKLIQIKSLWTKMDKGGSPDKDIMDIQQTL